jgi:hypothetical protein
MFMITRLPFLFVSLASARTLTGFCNDITAPTLDIETARGIVNALDKRKSILTTDLIRTTLMRIAGSSVEAADQFIDSHRAKSTPQNLAGVDTFIREFRRSHGEQESVQQVWESYSQRFSGHPVVPCSTLFVAYWVSTTGIGPSSHLFLPLAIYVDTIHMARIDPRLTRLPRKAARQPFQTVLPVIPEHTTEPVPRFLINQLVGSCEPDIDTPITPEVAQRIHAELWSMAPVTADQIMDALTADVGAEKMTEYVDFVKVRRMAISGDLYNFMKRIKEKIRIKLDIKVAWREFMKQHPSASDGCQTMHVFYSAVFPLIGTEQLKVENGTVDLDTGANLGQILWNDIRISGSYAAAPTGGVPRGLALLLTAADAVALGSS